MSANKEKCADKDKSVCGYNESGRLRYFHGMLLDDKDFSAEQEYHVNKRRFLNRMLHGSGVVCGLDLNGEKGGRWIEVTSGLALDCSGNEIWVPHTRRIDLDSLFPPKNKGKNQAECEEEEDKGKPKPYYIGIRYDEKPSNPVSVYLPSGSCDERTCENSRYREGYCIEVVQCCPEPDYQGLLKQFCECPKDTKYTASKNDNARCPSCSGLENQQLCQCLKLEEFYEQSVACPECCSCDEPCFVVLGQITVDEDGRLLTVCINECRRYVLTGRMIQHMILGVLGGAKDFFYMKTSRGDFYLPDGAELARNPMKALRWLLQYAVIEDGDFETTDCGKKTPDKPGLETQISNMVKQEVQLATAKYDDDIRRLSDSALEYTRRLDAIDLRGTTGLAITTEVPRRSEDQPAAEPQAETENQPAPGKTSTKSSKNPPK